MKRLKEWWRERREEINFCIESEDFRSFQRMERGFREDARKLREYKRITKRLPKLIAELERTTEKLRGLVK